MDDLLARLVKREIRLGLALVDVGLPSLRLGNTSAFEQARNRAEGTYFRARGQIQQLPESSRHLYLEQLQVLRSAIDSLPASPSRAGTDPDLLPSPTKIIDSPA